MDKRVCYYTNESFAERKPDGRVLYHIAYVTEGEAGYGMGYEHEDLATLEEMCRVGNEAKGLSETDVLDIVASSMRQGEV